MIPTLRDALGDMPLTLATHCRSGRAELVALEAVAEGVEAVWVASPPVAGGPSLPSGPYVVEALARDGFQCPASHDSLTEMADYFTALAESEAWPAAQHSLMDQSADDHQMPLSEMAWLESNRGSHVIDGVLAEIVAIRDDLGQMPMTAPIARRIARQAIENFAADARYKQCDAGFVGLVRGRLGPLPGPIDIALAPGMVEIANDNVERSVEAPDDAGAAARVIAACCGADALERLGPPLDPAAIPDIESPQDLLEATLGTHPALQSLKIQKGEFSYHWRAEAAT